MDNDTADLIKTIIWLLIFIFWIGFQFFKKLAGAIKAIKKDTAPQPQENGLKNGLSVFSRGSSTDKKAGSVRDSLRGFFEEVMKMQKAEKPEPPPLKKPDSKSVPRKKQRATTAASKPEEKTVHVLTQQTALSSEEIRPSLSAEDMRQAVIFSEILGQPLALRDRDDRQF
jgi:hypothetical protein